MCSSRREPSTMIGETRRTGASHSAESGAGPPSGLGTGPGGELPGGVVEDHAAFGDPRSLARAQAGGLADREGASLRYLLAVEASASTRDAVPARHTVGPPSGPACLSGGLQHNLARRATRLPNTCGGAAEPAFTRSRGRVACNPVSHQPQAVQVRAAKTRWLNREAQCRFARHRRYPNRKASNEAKTDWCCAQETGRLCNQVAV